MVRPGTLYHTLRPLRWRQWWYRAWRPLAMKLARPAGFEAGNLKITLPCPHLQLWPVAARFDPCENTFVLLNRKVSFGQRIDWHYRNEGPLWRFNLSYFEWLYDEGLSVGARLATVSAFCRDTRPGRGTEAYPASLRVMAWIWFDLKHGAFDTQIRRRLALDADWLRRFPEYHLDGNHLFENAISLCAAGAYFNNAKISAAGAAILRRCISDQLCDDGGHCEGSPMYHSLLLWRMLQCVDILMVRGAPETISEPLREAAGKMLGWLQAVTFSDGAWPAVNDAVAGIAPVPAVLFHAAKALGIRWQEARLEDSGYRMIRMPGYELFVDVDGIRPSWQPGHAHADTGTFCLHVLGRPVVVDSGCSTYENAELRARQRGTAAHNTVVLNGRDSSELWSRFRVGRRCRVLQVAEGPDSISISYSTASGTNICRRFRWGTDFIEVTDHIPRGAREAVFPLHLNPGVDATPSRIGNYIRIGYAGIGKIQLQNAEIAAGFNNLSSSACLLFHMVEQTASVRLQMRFNKQSVKEGVNR